MDHDILAFDVFGTLVDWFGGIAAEGRRIAPDRDVDWDRLAVDWSKEYGRSVKALRTYVNLDVLLASAFHRLAPRHGLKDLPLADAIELSTAWSRLPAWPDASSGLARLKGRIPLAALTNANKAMLVSLASFSGLPFDQLISAEEAAAYKPDPAVYRLVNDYGHFPHYPTGNVFMVASHCFDLNAARKIGMGTILIEREGEPDTEQTGLDHAPDYIFTSVAEMADELLRPE